MYIKATQCRKLPDFVQLKMKFLILTVVAFAAVTQAELNWSNKEQNEINVKSVEPAYQLPKIVGGQEAERHQFPHQLFLKITKLTGSTAVCGGTPIRDDVVLTAAHCVDKAIIVRVTAGAHNVRQSEPAQQIIYSNNFIVHEGWNKTSRKGVDIALVLLPRKLYIDGETVKTISLPEAFCPDNTTDNVLSTISGWGEISSKMTPVLHYASGPIMSNAVCGQYYNHISNSHICFTGAGGRGACSGDSGGPMIISTSNGIQQVGITSFVSGEGCELGYPSVYVRVSCFIDWINSKIN